MDGTAHPLIRTRNVQVWLFFPPLNAGHIVVSKTEHLFLRLAWKRSVAVAFQSIPEEGAPAAAFCQEVNRIASPFAYFFFSLVRSTLMSSAVSKICSTSSLIICISNDFRSFRACPCCEGNVDLALLWLEMSAPERPETNDQWRMWEEMGKLGRRTSAPLASFWLYNVAFSMVLSSNTLLSVSRVSLASIKIHYIIVSVFLFFFLKCNHCIEYTKENVRIQGVWCYEWMIWVMWGCG